MCVEVHARAIEQGAGSLRLRNNGHPARRAAAFTRLSLAQWAPQPTWMSNCIAPAARPADRDRTPGQHHGEEGGIQRAQNPHGLAGKHVVGRVWGRVKACRDRTRGQHHGEEGRVQRRTCARSGWQTCSG